MLSQIANAAKSAATWGANSVSTSKKTVDGVHVHRGCKPEGKGKPHFQKDELQLGKKQPAGGHAGKLAEKGENKPALKDELESKHGKLFQPMTGEKGGFQLEGKPGLDDKPQLEGKPGWKGKEADVELDDQDLGGDQ